jgi:hypothetical protein
VYVPLVTAEIDFHVGDTQVDSQVLLFPVDDHGGVEWSQVLIADFDARALATSTDEDGQYQRLHEAMSQPDSYLRWSKFIGPGMTSESAQYWSASYFELISKPNEPLEDFKLRVAEKAEFAEGVVMKNLEAKYDERLQLLKSELAKTSHQSPTDPEQPSVTAVVNYRRQREHLKNAVRQKAEQMREKIALAKSQIQSIAPQPRIVRLALGWAPHEELDDQGSLRALYIEDKNR